MWTVSRRGRCWICRSEGGKHCRGIGVGHRVVADMSAPQARRAECRGGGTGMSRATSASYGPLHHRHLGVVVRLISRHAHERQRARWRDRTLARIGRYSAARMARIPPIERVAIVGVSHTSRRYRATCAICADAPVPARTSGPAPGSSRALRPQVLWPADRAGAGGAQCV